MYLNTGYLNHSHMDFKDKSRPLIVGSCGTYRLSRHPKLPTYRPRGRLDYQIIYITAGCGHFHFDNVNNETIVPAGNIVLYRPKELQKYEYYGEDKTEVYWIHFTGSNVKNILRQYGFPDKERVFQVGTSNEYEQIFKRIIIELQRCQDNYEEMLVLLLRHLLISFHRELTREHILKNEYLDHEMDKELSQNYLYILTICVMLYVIYKSRDFWRAFIWHMITKKSQVLWNRFFRSCHSYLTNGSAGYWLPVLQKGMGMAALNWSVTRAAWISVQYVQAFAK